MKISEDWLSGSVQRVFRLLEDGGHSVFAVGGCVRNSLIGEPVNDVDLATNARPDRVLELGVAAGLKVVPTGIDHGTVTVIVEGEGFEVTTFRQDVETDGRRAVVAFSNDITTDAMRRDFTINALYVDSFGQISDPLGGLGDIPDRRIRFINDPDERIREDGLRILRFFRFFASFGAPSGGIDPDGLAACASNLDMLKDISSERIGAEMRKLLNTSDPAPTVAAMEASGVLQHIMPGAVAAGLAPLVHAEAGRESHWLRRLSAIGGNAVSDRLRLSKAEVKALSAIKSTLEDGLEIKLAAYKFGEGVAVDAALIVASLSGSVGQSGIEALASEGASIKFPIKARMVMDYVSPGPDMGHLLRRLEETWIDSDFKLSKAALLAMAAR